MMFKIFAVSAPLSAFLFPWPFTAVLALSAALFEPLIPLASGILIDVLYYSSYSDTLPLFTIAGAITTGGSYFVRARLKTRTMSP